MFRCAILGRYWREADLSGLTGKFLEQWFGSVGRFVIRARIADDAVMIFYFTRHPTAPHVHIKVRGSFENADTSPAFTSGAKMFSNLAAFIDAADAAGLSDESLIEVRSFAAASEKQGEAKFKDIEITEAQLLSIGFTLEHGNERQFVVSYVGQERSDGQKAVVVTAKEHNPLPLTKAEVRAKPMLLSELNDKLWMIERTISELHYPPFGPNLPAKAKISESDLVLLCYKKSLRQQGHLGRERARWVAIWRRRVAIEYGLCLSVRTGKRRGACSCLVRVVSEGGGCPPALGANLAEGGKHRSRTRKP